jgi:hypothetical protein
MLGRALGIGITLASVVLACSASDNGAGTSGTGGFAAGGSGGGSDASTGGTGNASGTGASGGGIGIDVNVDSASDAANCPDGSVPGDPGCECGKLEFQIDTQQSCAISVLPGFTLDGEGFINLGGQDHRVFAMDRWGKGHVVAWCDSTTLPQLLAAFNVTGYLAQKENPKVLSFGDDYLCKPGGIPGNPLPSYVTYQGQDLPAKYKNDATQLAADWDVVIFCGFRIGWSNDWSPEIAEFVSVHGKGFLGVMDYEGVVQQNDFTNMSKITAPAGIQFDPLNLAWAPSSTSVSIECVPDLPPPVK